MKKRLFFMILGLVFIIACLSTPLFAADQSQATGINVQYHSQAEIKAFLQQSGAKTTDKESYKIAPVLTAPFSGGTLNSASLTSALAMVNQMRYIAGISYDVTLNNAYTQYAQDAALIGYLNGNISHTPSKPNGMSDDLYDSAYTGTSSSNLAMGYSTLNTAISSGWISDGDTYNINRVGHRRWVLYPDLTATGFGAVGNSYAMYVFDFAGSSSNYGVCWPAQNMPIDYFEDHDPWSISMGETVNSSAVSVEIVRLSDQKSWRFSQSGQSDGYFNVNNDGYGDTGCIIFRPNDITYNAGDSFEVTVSGLDTPVKYQVNFFALTTSGFSDVPDNAWYAPFVADLTEKNIIDGKGNGIFDPEGTIKRAEFAKILATASGDDLGSYQGNTIFSDVSKNAWYAKYVQWAHENGIVSGTSATTFAPEENISRQEMAVMLMRYADDKQFHLTQSVAPVTFSDNASIADWAKEAVSTMQQAGIINGMGNNIFQPLGNSTRAQAAKMISELLKLQ